jgi:hypothetical protein
MGVMFLREMNATQAEAEGAEALRMAQEQYSEALTEWRRVEDACRGEDAAAYRCRRPRPAPEAPTRESAAATLAPERNVEIVYRNPTFTEEDGRYTFLVAVAPGRYALYGQRDGNGAGWAGVCLCMGSVRFEVAAGQVVDLGTITYPALEAAGARDSTNSAFTGALESSIAIVPPDLQATPPARLSGLNIVPAQLRAAGKMPNMFGLYIDRHPALAGVLGYERDRVIDLAPAP